MQTSHSTVASDEKLNLREQAFPLYAAAKTVGAVGLVATIIIGFLTDRTFERFFYAYLVAYGFFLALALGGLFFVLIQHVTKAAWSVNVRRIAEWLCGALPVVCALSAPIFIAIILHNGFLYRWNVAGWAGDHPRFKIIYLNPVFFIFRMVIDFVVWSLMGVWYAKQSAKQDTSGDANITRKMQMYAPICTVIYGLTVTLAAFDLFMTLDPDWDSTIFGVYFFAGAMVTVFSFIILAALLLQSRGFLRESITIEHYHDLGKFLFAFTFFWGYIGFSQYMLQWYGNMPDETHWWKTRGASTADPNGYSPVLIALLLGHVLFPMAFLLSRHVKRTPKVLAFAAAWLMFFELLDLFWIVTPEYAAGRLDAHDIFVWIVTIVPAFVGIGGVVLAVVVRKAANNALRPLGDPRLVDSMSFENV